MTASTTSLDQIPFLGSGLGFRRNLKQVIFDHEEHIDFLEIITEQYANSPPIWEELEEVGEKFQIIPHGIRMSIGSTLPLDKEYMRGIRRISEITKAPYYSEHLCMTRVPGVDIGHLSPLWFSEDVLQATIDKVNFVQDYLQKPLALENVTYLFDLPHAPMSQTEFFNRMVDATGCLVLLDVTNVYINSMNHEFDGERFLDELPLDRVVQLHLAGGYWKDDVLIDGHCEKVEDGTWDLLKLVAEKTTMVRGSILEHDSNYPEDFTELLETLATARQIMGWNTAPRRKIA